MNPKKHCFYLLNTNILHKKLISNYKHVYLCLFLSVVIIFSSCGIGNNSNDNTASQGELQSTSQIDKHSPQALSSQEEFDNFTDNIFKKEIVYNTINLHYTIAHPENIGINSYNVTLGHLSKSEYDKTIEDSKTYLDNLLQYNYDLLTSEQQVTYDLLKDSLSELLLSTEFYLYDEYLSPNNGMPSTIPTLLVDYSFYDEKDIQDYLEILKLFPSYFKEIIDYEKEKSNAGLFMADWEADLSIDQCREFLQNKESHFLIEEFNNKINSLSSIDSEKKEEYKNTNKNLMDTSVFPAYEYIIEEVTKLKGTGRNSGGICNLANGKKYYETLVKEYTGSNKDINTIKGIIKDKLAGDFLQCSAILIKNPDLLEEINNCPTDVNNEKQLLDFLKAGISDDFPNGPNVSCDIKYVSPNMEKYTNPAYYLIPAIDNYNNNTFYINKSYNAEGMGKYTTVAHETYPGHLYQSTYFASLNPSYIRNLLSYGGYTEGYGIYSELYSVSISGLSEDAASLYVMNSTLTYGIYCLADIGVNYDGWALEDLEKFLSDYGFGSEEAKQMFQLVIEDPGVYLKYYFGYLEFIELRDKAKEALGSNFSLCEFHKFILDFGPAPFYIIEEYMNKWIETQK